MCQTGFPKKHPKSLEERPIKNVYTLQQKCSFEANINVRETVTVSRISADPRTNVLEKLQPSERQGQREKERKRGITVMAELKMGLLNQRMWNTPPPPKKKNPYGQSR